MWTAAFWKATAERALKTFAQTLVALVVGDGTGVTSIVVGDLDWGDILVTSGIAAAVSVLMSLGSSVITSSPGPSLTTAEVLSPPAPSDTP